MALDEARRLGGGGAPSILGSAVDGSADGFRFVGGITDGGWRCVWYVADECRMEWQAALSLCKRATENIRDKERVTRRNEDEICCRRRMKYSRLASRTTNNCQWNSSTESHSVLRDKTTPPFFATRISINPPTTFVLGEPSHMLPWRACTQLAARIGCCPIPCRRFATFTRPQSPEMVSVPCRGNGNITLEIHHASQVNAYTTGSSAVTVYLPRGPCLNAAEDDESNIAILRSSLNCPIVRVNYRCDKNHRHPTAIHDVTSALDFIVSNLLPKRAFFRFRPGRSEHVGRLAVCGELVGGQLATALALTECRADEPGIVAAAVSNPIADWTELDIECLSDVVARRSSSRTQQLNLAFERLRTQRDVLFRKSQHYFDPFASPILFFRSPGVHVPEMTEQKILDDMDQLVLFAREEYVRQDSAISKNPPMKDAPSPREKEEPPKRTSNRYPSKAFNLRLPSFHITAGLASALSDQAAELAKQLNKSFARQSKSTAFDIHSRWDDDLVAPDMGRVMYQTYTGMGLWNASNEGKARMTEAARWLARELQ
ncbi:hypothetical protein AC578_1413 [Pseudocercospora eumusae]|uniref:Alpha/beta hydrolase fold-3 domain-containing protein n=1 Tax=Pseudocercospora eumusae TaxID=321146 RepID=A0A139HUN4_9PEZI|nr:hypothetical protein AC578_1413 [Pseudocercospora eumusae]